MVTVLFLGEAPGDGPVSPLTSAPNRVMLLPLDVAFVRPGSSEWRQDCRMNFGLMCDTRTSFLAMNRYHLARWSGQLED